MKRNEPTRSQALEAIENILAEDPILQNHHAPKACWTYLYIASITAIAVVGLATQEPKLLPIGGPTILIGALASAYFLHRLVIKAKTIEVARRTSPFILEAIYHNSLQVLQRGNQYHLTTRATTTKISAPSAQLLRTIHQKLVPGSEPHPSLPLPKYQKTQPSKSRITQLA